MKLTSRRAFIQQGVTLAGAAAAAPLLAGDGQSADNHAHTTLTSAQSPFSAVKIIDTDSMPWPPAATEGGWEVKTLFKNEQTGDHLTLINIPIGGPGGRQHYHTFHEWAYWLTGDFVNNEYTSPYQRTGVFQQFREGVFLDRPAYSLHGGEVGRLDSQVGGTCLIMEEGGRTVDVIPGESGYSEDFKDVKQWSVPRIIDTISDLPWEPDGSHEGVLVKRLVEDQERGFRAILWRVPGGWSSARAPQFARPYYYKNAHQFNYVLNGDLRIQTYASPERKAEIVSLGKSFYFERAPMSILGFPDGAVSNVGCVWLEITYAKGTSISFTPIEEPTYV